MTPAMSGADTFDVASSSSSGGFDTSFAVDWAARLVTRPNTTMHPDPKRNARSTIPPLWNQPRKMVSQWPRCGKARRQPSREIDGRFNRPYPLLSGQNMFPPPSPWSQRSAVDPAREYIAFTSAFHLKSFRRAPAFIRRAYKIMKQADAAPGIVGWSIGFNLFSLDFYTLSVWQDNDSLRRFVREGDHLTSLTEFEHDLRRSTTFVHFRLFGRDVPATWKDALQRLRQRDATHTPRTM